jgi:hypothetical protein
VSRPFNLGQCRRTSGPSHVVEGGGVALEPTPLCCEKPLGPSRHTGDAPHRRPKHGSHESFRTWEIERSEREIEEAMKEAHFCGPIMFPEEDRSSPVQTGRHSRRRIDPLSVQGYSPDQGQRRLACCMRQPPPTPDPAFSLEG